MSDEPEGRYLVRRTRAATREAKSLFHKARDREEVRRAALKLRWFPDAGPDAAHVVDLDWEWIKGEKAPRNIGELRLGNIGPHANLRLIFYRGEETTRFYRAGGRTHVFRGESGVRNPLPAIWLLRIFAKKRDDFTTAQLALFRQARLAVEREFYQ